MDRSADGGSRGRERVASAAARRILLFAKPPVPGRVKTRLAPLLGPEGAAELYAAFLEDVVAAVRPVQAGAELWLEPATGEHPDRRATARAEGAALAERLGLRLRWQAEGEELGGRLRGAFDRAFADGVAEAVALGSDHPTLPPARLAEAFRALATARVTVGPSRDGGYYLIGLSRSAWPGAADLFREVPWSTPRVLAVTRGRIESLRLRARELPAWYDVDEPGDLAVLRRHVSPDSRTAAALARLLPSEEAGGSPGAVPATPRP